MTCAYNLSRRRSPQGVSGRLLQARGSGSVDCCTRYWTRVDRAKPNDVSRTHGIPTRRTRLRSSVAHVSVRTHLGRSIQWCCRMQLRSARTLQRSRRKRHCHWSTQAHSTTLDRSCTCGVLKCIAARLVSDGLASCRVASRVVVQPAAAAWIVVDVDGSHSACEFVGTHTQHPT
jgi:hypothetical protein